MPLQGRVPSNNWQVATPGESNWRCHIKHKWQYLETNKLRACERCGQMQGRRDYLALIVGASNLPSMPKPPPAPPPKRTPWHEREQWELANDPTLPSKPNLSTFRPSSRYYEKEQWEASRTKYVIG